MNLVRTHWLPSLLAVGMALAPAYAGAEEPYAVKSMDEFLDYQYALREAVESGEGRFASLSPTDRAKLIRAQDEIFRILDGKSSARRLNDRDRRSLYNAQHVVAAVVTQNDDDRSICRNMNDLGTHISTVQCRTVAEVAATRVDNRDRFARLQKCKGSECSP